MDKLLPGNRLAMLGALCLAATVSTVAAQGQLRHADQPLACAVVQMTAATAMPVVLTLDRAMPTALSIASGSAWTTQEDWAQGRSVRFSYTFENLDTLMNALMPAGHHSVSEATVRVFRGEGREAPTASVLDLSLKGRARRASWSDTVLDPAPAGQSAPSDHWLVWLNLEGSTQATANVQPQAFTAQLACPLPVAR